MPHRRRPDPGEDGVELPGGFRAAADQVEFVRSELARVAASLEGLTGERLDEARLARGIKAANEVRHLLDQLRRLTFTATTCPLPALELLIAEMLAIHYCSDRDQPIDVLTELLGEVRRRTAAGEGVLPPEAARVFWVNPVADLRVMNLLEDCGGRLCGTENLFSHALDPIPEDLPPMEALARMALADPMVGPADDRAKRVVRDAREFGAEALVISRIPGASHCALEGGVIRELVRSELGIPAIEIDVPPVSDPVRPALRTRLEALTEAVRQRRRECSTPG